MVRSQSFKSKVIKLKVIHYIKRYFKYFFLFQLVKGIIWLCVFFTGWSLFK